MKRLRRSSKPSHILKSLLLAGGVMTLSLVSPVGGARIVSQLARAYIRRKRFEKQKLLRDLKHLQRRQLIAYQEFPDGRVKLTLSRKGKKEALVHRLDDMRLDAAKPWDGKWRLVMFDIPHAKKQARDALRQKLSSLGLYPIQKSVFITPYPCEREIDFIASVFDVRDHILFMNISSFEGEEKLRFHFRL